MRTVFLLFDSLNRHALGCYGGRDVPTPNIDRVAARGVRFDNHWAGSLPCMPARREIHTGRLNFLHRSWGPLEPFDDSFARILDQSGVYSHLVTDHYHYWEEGGCAYHNQYSSFEFHRGQEKDKWKGLVDLPTERWSAVHHPTRVPEARDAGLNSVNLTNRDYQAAEKDYSLVGTISDAIAFLKPTRARMTGCSMLNASTRTSPSLRQSGSGTRSRPITTAQFSIGRFTTASPKLLMRLTRFGRVTRPC
jgi:arylsulfatase A-like enzyme